MPLNPANLIPQPGEAQFTYASRCITEAEAFGATPGDALIFAALMLLLMQTGVFAQRPFQ